MRNDTLDIVKTLSALMVVCIHTGYPGELGVYIVAICRIAVPLFLLISGYYYPILVERGGLKRYIKKIIYLTLVASLFYIVVEQPPLYEILTFHRFEKLFIMSLPLAGDHLWYLYSLINVVCVVGVVNYMRIGNKLFYLIPLLLMTNYILSFYPAFWRYRNFLFTSLPYFLIGCLFQRYKHHLLPKFRMKGGFIGAVLIIEVMLLYMEISLYKYFNLLVVRDHYFMTPILAVTILGYSLSVISDKQTFMGYWGRKYSSYIYIFHLYVMNQFFILLSMCHFDKRLISYFCPFIVFVVTLTGIVIIKRIYDTIKTFV